MENFTIKQKLFLLLIFVIPFFTIYAQTVTTPQVNFLQRSSAATPTKKIYNVKGDFTMLGNTNLTLATYGDNIDNQYNYMKFVDTDTDPATFNSSKATLELSNGGENTASQNCSTVLFAGLYWTGKSSSSDTFTASRQVQSGTKTVNTNSTVGHNQSITDSNYSLAITVNNSGNSRWPVYTFSGNGNTYAFEFNNTPTITLRVNNSPTTSNILFTSVSSGGVYTATLTTPYVIADGGVNLTINQLIRSSATDNNNSTVQSTSSAAINVSGTVPNYITDSKSFNKKAIKLKGPGASTYTTITAKTVGANSELLFPGTTYSGIFVGYQEITDYVKANGPGAYTVADIALLEAGSNNDSPGFSGGWTMIVIYENPVMKSRAVTLFDGYAYVNGTLNSNAGEFGNIPISGFTTVGTGPVNMKLGVMAAEGDVGLSGDYLAVQKLNADPNTYNATNYLTLNHAGNTTNNFFNSSIFPIPAAGKSDPILKNNTGVDFSMFTIPNTSNLVIGNNQTSTTFRFGSSGDIFTIFGFAMSVDAYIPEPQGLIVVNKIGGVTPATPLTALPGDEIEYKIDIKNRGSEPTKNTIITVPVPVSALYGVGSITTSLIHPSFTPANAPYYDSGSNSVIWNVGNLPLLSDPNTLLGSLIFKVTLTTDCATLFNSGCNASISINGAITGNGSISNTAFNLPISQGSDPTSSCGGLIFKPILVNFNSSNSPCFAALAGPDKAPPVCGLEAVTLGATAGTSGTWSIASGPAGGGELFSNINSPTTEFSSPNTGGYTLRWTLPFGGGSCTPIIDDVLVSIGLCNKLDFDGIDDNVNLKNNYNLNTGSFSIETWIKPGASNAGIQTIFSKRSSSALTDGYDLRLVNNVVSFNWNNSNAITSNYAINTGRWYHIAVTFNGTSYNLYIDGISVKNATAGANPVANNNAKCILGAMIQGSNYPYLPTNYFKGWMQELRIWNVALTTAQTRQMMNQRITNTSTNVLGAIVPLTVPGLSWSNLEGYYQMTQSTDVLNGFLVDKTSNLRNGKLIGIVTAQPETAPLPYTSSAHTPWETSSTWTNGSVWNIPNTLGVDGTTYIDWNIVKTNNNITTAGNKTVLGLLVESNTLEANNNNKIEISHYLKLDGKIDLVGRSQLVQTEGSILDVASSGSIERDQLGQSNKYNYNYWSSPVSPINTTQNNKDYTVAGVMKDGTTTTPQNINWVGGYDGSPTAPISVARYWLYKFDSLNNDYANWTQFLETAPLRVGLGYTMKGSGSALGNQTYTFVGKPNNGTIASSTVGDDQLLLTGNPYPSAIDADAFINDNIGAIESFSSPSLDGTLYFWEHYATNNTHILRDYQGGYAVRNLTGGIAPASAGIDFISQSGTPSRGIPNRFIPVGQGFFVNGKIGSGGTIVFKNSQRGFHKEDDATYSNVIYKTKKDVKQTWKSNENDTETADTSKRIRLGFNSHNDFHRQVLLGFMNEKATAGIDAGYDGLNIDDFPNDMYFLNEENQLAIQGEGYFDTSASYPIGIKTDAEGTVKFMIDGLENIDIEQTIFIYDNDTDMYHDIRNEAFEITVPKGENNTRFSLRFTYKKLRVDEKKINDNTIKINYLQNGNSLVINNNLLDTIVTKVTLFNIVGQSISTWEIKNQSQQNIQLPIKKVSSGVYIARIQTSKGDFSKKIIIP
ncbi:Por secretion system C-terminal sorting domain-containing protein [Flavobacterium gillisiae]|uniref:Por secretion system C-terminal sorting domain-containing protein n=1 Tax=Flavobacterium gillisiae TaxID=150146 RepID=A0A1H4GD23_9FLAO|nr:LamG-like jellyroll fold domain-containing protein [Flavobacterium gillisiae]SEB06890.1 Por secretion system C-terminal sorting domain-containing protein [Flavobacterium gillisiae]